MQPKGGMHKMESMPKAISLALEETKIKLVMYGLEWSATHPPSLCNEP